MISRRGLVLLGLGAVAAEALAACSPSLETQSVPLMPPSPSPKGENPVSGIIGDGFADDGPALEAMLNSAAAVGAPVTLAAHSRLRIASTVFVPSNTRFDGNGATLVNECANDGHIFRLVKVENVTIKNVNFDGQATHTEATDQRHNVSLAGVRNVRIERIRSSNAMGDGLYIGDHLSGPSVKVSLRDSDFDNNHRQGMSVTCVSGLTVTNCSFRNTAGTSPQAGVDIEPNTDASTIAGLVFRGCNFTRNAGGGLVISLRYTPTSRQQSGTYVDCKFDNNPGSPGVLLANSRRARFIRGQMNGNGRNGLALYSAPGHATISYDTSLSGVYLVGNTNAGIRASSSYKGMLIASCVLDRNGTGAPASSYGLDSVLTGGSTGDNLVVVNNTFSDMRIGLRTSPQCSHVTLSGNRYTSLTTSRILKDDPRTRADFESPVDR